MTSMIGQRAPDFTLVNQHGEQVSLSQFAGVKKLVMVFFPFAFSGVCTGEMQEMRDLFADLANETTELLAISCDHMFSLRAFADRDGYEFSLLSDFWPHGEVSSAYGVFDATRGCPRRATVIVDRAGVVRWRVVNDISEARRIDEYRSIVNAMP